jgi:N-acetylneuraminate synthase/N,N'-diacetyllegionaminate synthase
MASMDEIDEAIETLRNNGAREICLMHCVSWYPAAVEDMNIRVIDTLQKRYGIPVGLSDHTMGLHVACAARALGAKLFEKHFTLSRRDFGPDHVASLEPEELKALVRQVDEVGRSLGNGEKRVTPIEIEQRKVFRRSLVARCPIPRGTVITAAHLATKRPGYGIPPKEMDDLIGALAKQDIAADEPIRWEMIERRT